ncbi:hypothetical protein WJX74_008669 [Apatococcus lobatus]|uniref:DRBM domain-containing protein n=1 Tax=Apatococcus lobatus TaxID=904363 RepID=A0AAW1RZD6_9CHLO
MLPVVRLRASKAYPLGLSPLSFPQGDLQIALHGCSEETAEKASGSLRCKRDRRGGDAHWSRRLQHWIAQRALREESKQFTTDHVEAEVGLPQEVGSEMVRLFIAAGVPEDLPSSSEAGEEWEEVRWLPWQPLLSAGPHHLLGPHGQAPQRELIRPFLNLILKWHDRHKHVYQQEAVSEDAAQELGDIAVFRPSTWKGPLPRETLSHWCQLNQVADAYYTILDGQHPLFKSASCILSHRAAVITPEWAYSRAEDAMDNAALAAIMFLERGLNAATHRCKICTVGEVPQLGPLQYMARRGEFASLLASQSAALFAEKERVRQELEAQQASIEAQLNAVTQQQEVLNSQVFEEDAVLTADDVAATVEQLPSAVSLPVFNDAPPSQGKAKRQKTGKAAAKAAVAASNPGQSHNQNPVQTLKETLDKKKWPQALVSFTKREGQPGHTCKLDITNCGITQSATASSQKLAKAAAAENALNAMRRMGLYL